MKSLNKNITLHSSCHSRAQNIGPKSAQILKLIPDTKLLMLKNARDMEVRGVLKKME